MVHGRVPRTQKLTSPSTETPELSNVLTVKYGVSQTIKFPLTIKNPELSNVFSLKYGLDRTIKFPLY